MKKILSFLMVALFSATMFADDTYTVVGASTVLFGQAWNPEYAANDMTLVDGVYTIKYEDKALTAGNYEYKIVLNHSWATSYPQLGNATFNIHETATYDVTFTLDLAKEDPKYSVVATKKGGAEIDDKAQLAGKFNSWSATDMTLSGDKKSASITLALDRDTTYEFKTVINDGWRGNGKEFTRKENALAGLTGNTANMKFTADWSGEYTFVWTFANDSLTILFPDFPEITLADGFYPIGLNGHWTIYDIDPAHKFVANEEADPEVEEYILKDITLVEGQSFKVIEVKEKALIDVWYGAEGGNNYDVTKDVAGVRDIYFRPTANPEWGDGHIFVNWEGPATAVDNTEATVKAVKSLENGMLIIEKNGVRFNAQGQMVR